MGTMLSQEQLAAILRATGQLPPVSPSVSAVAAAAAAAGRRTGGVVAEAFAVVVAGRQPRQAGEGAAAQERPAAER